MIRQRESGLKISAQSLRSLPKRARNGWTPSFAAKQACGARPSRHPELASTERRQTFSLLANEPSKVPAEALLLAHRNEMGMSASTSARGGQPEEICSV